MNNEQIDALYRRLRPWVYYHIGPCFRSEMDDVVQDVMLQAVLQFGQLRDATKLEPWAKTIALRKCHSLHRRARRIPTYVTPTDAVADESPSPYTTLLKKELEDLLARSLQSDLKLLREIYEYPSAAAYAEARGICKNYIRVMRQRALSRVRSVIRKGKP